MENNILDLLLFPEFILSVGAIAILLIGLFTTKNAFSFTSNLSVILLIIVGIIIYINKNITVAYFNIFFKESSFILFFQILVVIGSIACIIISANLVHCLLYRLWMKNLLPQVADQEFHLILNFLQNFLFFL